MTRRDFVLIAEALNDVRATYAPHWDSNLFRACDDCARLMAERLGRTNARFDTERFLKAAGVQS